MCRPCAVFAQLHHSRTQPQLRCAEVQPHRDKSSVLDLRARNLGYPSAPLDEEIAAARGLVWRQHNDAWAMMRCDAIAGGDAQPCPTVPYL
eukprot:6198417-Pleurochrysis_carterae.AAC.1